MSRALSSSCCQGGVYCATSAPLESEPDVTPITSLLWRIVMSCGFCTIRAEAATPESSSRPRKAPRRHEPFVGRERYAGALRLAIAALTVESIRTRSPSF